MEIGVRVEAEDLISGVRRHTNSCYLTFVAVDDVGHPHGSPAARSRERSREAALRSRKGTSPSPARGAGRGSTTVRSPTTWHFRWRKYANSLDLMAPSGGSTSRTRARATQWSSTDTLTLARPLDRYAWYITKGAEAHDVTARLDKRTVLDSLADADVQRLFRRSMPVSTARRTTTDSTR